MQKIVTHLWFDIKRLKKQQYSMPHYKKPTMVSKGTVTKKKVCSRGHRFHISGPCPVCSAGRNKSKSQESTC